MKNLKLILSILLLYVFWKSYSQIAPGTYTITSKLVNRNLDIKWADKNNGTRLHIWDPNGGEAQKFKVENSNETGYYYIKSEWGKCLTVNGNDPNILDMWDCINGNNQKWKFVDTRDGHYNIQSKLGTYIDVRWAKRENGSEIGMSGYSTWENNGAQRWKFEMIGGNSNNSVLVIGTEITKFPDISNMKISSDITNVEDGIATSFSLEQSKETTRSINDEEATDDRVCWTEKINWETSEIWTFGDMEKEIYIGAIYNARDNVQGNYLKKDVNISSKPKVELKIGPFIANVSNNLKDFNHLEGKKCIKEIVTNLCQNNTNYNPSTNMEFVIEEVTNEREAKIICGINYKEFGSNLNKNTLHQKIYHDKRIFIVKFKQTYFTAVLNSAFFKPNLVDNKELVIIDEVEFGAIGFMAIETLLNKEELGLALNFLIDPKHTYEGKTVGPNLLNALGKSKVQGYVFGGTLDKYHFDGNGIPNIDWFKGNNKFNKDILFSPIKYKYRYLSNGERVNMIQRSKINRRICDHHDYIQIQMKNIFICEEGKRDVYDRKLINGLVSVSLYDNGLEVLPKDNRKKEIFSSECIALSPVYEKENNPIYLFSKGGRIDYKIDRIKLASKSYYFDVKFNLCVKHQDNAYASYDWHCLKPVNEYVREKIEFSSYVINKGPYITPTNRRHEFWLQFKINELTNY